MEVGGDLFCRSPLQMLRHQFAARSSTSALGLLSMGQGTRMIGSGNELPTLNLP